MAIQTGASVGAALLRKLLMQPVTPLIIGEKIQIARKAKGFSQHELRAKVSLSRVSISHIENGKQKSLRPETLRKLAEAPEKSETYFYEEPVSSLDSLPDVLKEVITELLDLPYVEQERLSFIFKQIVTLVAQ